MMKFVRNDHRLRLLPLLIWAWLLCSAPAAFAQNSAVELSNSVWKGGNEDVSFVLTFAPTGAAQKILTATLKGLGKETIELRGEYATEGGPEGRLLLNGNLGREKVSLDFKLN
jgi:hypothetical protein